MPCCLSPGCAQCPVSWKLKSMLSRCCPERPSWPSASITQTSPGVKRLSKVANVQIKENNQHTDELLTARFQPSSKTAGPSRAIFIQTILKMWHLCPAAHVKRTQLEENEVVLRVIQAI